MKNLIYILLILFCCNSCSNEENPTVSKLIGKWQLTHFYGLDEDTNEIDWHPVVNGYYLEFKNNLSFTTTEPNTCPQGKFTCDPKTLNFYHKCTDNNYLLAYKIIELSDNTLIIEPNWLECTEGCQYKFIKITN